MFIKRFMETAWAALYSYDEGSQLLIVRQELEKVIASDSMASRTFSTELERLGSGGRVIEVIMAEINRQQEMRRSIDWQACFLKELEELKRVLPTTSYSFMGRLEILAKLYGFDIQQLDEDNHILFEMVRAKVA